MPNRKKNKQDKLKKNFNIPNHLRQTIYTVKQKFTNQNERIILFGGNTHNIRPIISSKAKKAKGKVGKRYRKQNWGTGKE